ncbi:MAG: CvpA family protein [Deltaproteobacteria bacterium]|nr:CvpA family protein [Deltaproteobacteria bacterium]
MAEFESVDIVVGAIIGIACLRGFFLGLIREAFSLASLAAAYIAVKAFVGPVSEWVGDISGGRINEALEPWVAGALLVLVTIGAVTTVGRIIRRGARAVGLGFVDRVGGGLLPAIANTRTLAALEEMELLASEAPPTEIDVASPPKSD